MGSDSHLRSLCKTISWRFFATLITMGVALVVTRRLSLALSIGLADTLIKLGSYYFHERLWERIRFGRAKPPEYNI